MPAFIDKLIVELEAGRVSEAILLTNNSTDTEWFYVVTRDCASICFTDGRISSRRRAMPIVLPTQGQAFFYFGNNVDGFERIFEPPRKRGEPPPPDSIGVCVRPRPSMSDKLPDMAPVLLPEQASPP